MKQYLLSIEQPDGPPPAPDVMAEIVSRLDRLNADLHAEGSWVFAGGLHPPTTATVVRSANASLLFTDGPYTEGKEHIGGIMIITAPDLDRALHWAGRLAEATTLPIEVRPFQDGPG